MRRDRVREMAEPPTHKPRVVVLAGPNGAGKSTVAPLLLRGALAVEEFVNADTIASGLSAFRPEEAAFTAGRMLIERIRALARRNASFAFETTLAGRSYAPWIARLRQRGYAMHLAFLWLPDADLAIRRVADRVRRGGHGVPEGILRRRFRSGLRNLARLYLPLADSWRVYDNSGVGPRPVACGVRGAPPHGPASRRAPMSGRKKPIDYTEVFNDGRAVEEALRAGAREAARLHRLEGLPLAIWRRGRPVWISAEEYEREMDALPPVSAPPPGLHAALGYSLTP